MLGTWCSHFVARQVVCFVDNNAVRDPLISRKTSGKVANKILEAVLENETSNSLMMWFARVPPKSHIIADDPSRGCNKLLDNLGSRTVNIDVNQWLDASVPIVVGELMARRSPLSQKVRSSLF